jgi:hypothetical protein
MNAGKPSGHQGGHAVDGPTAANGASGEGAGSALEAMLRKRQMRVDPQPDLAAAPTEQQQDGKPAKE